MEIDIDAYQLQGRHCPHCQKGVYKALEVGELLVKKKFQTYFLLECLDCGFLWNEIYRLDQIEVEPNELDIATWTLDS